MQARFLLALAAVVVVAVFVATAAAQVEEVVGRVVSRAGYNVTGTIKFSRNADSSINVTVDMTGFNLTDTRIGIHIHTWGDLSDVYSTTTLEFPNLGPHWDPAGTGVHGCPDEGTSQPSHAGDLGNWNITGNSIQLTKVITNAALTFSGANSIVGRAVLIHNSTDTCTNVAIPSNTRMAAAVLGISSIAGNTAAAAPNAQAGFAWLLRTTNSGAARVYYSDENDGVVVCRGCGAGAAIQNSVSTDINSQARIQARVTNIESNDNGFHIHTWGDVSDTFDGSKAGGHWNPNGALHGLPSDSEREVGDLGYFRASMDDNSILVYNALNPLLTNISTVIGRSFVVHIDTDHGSALDSNTSTPFNCSQSGTWAGAAGVRILQGVIGLANIANLVEPAMTDTEVSLSSFQPSSCVLAKANNNSAGILAVPALFLLALIAAAASLFA